MKRVNQFYSIILLSLLFLCSCNSVKTIDYNEVSYGTEVSSLKEINGSKPNEEVKNEDDSTSYVYKKSKILDYTGTMTYCAVEEKILFSRWETVTEDEKESEDIYQALCDFMQEQYGEGTESSDGNNSNTTIYQGKNKTVIVAYLKETNKYTISITDMEQNPNIQPTSTPKTSEKEKKANENSENIAEKKGK